MKKQTALEICGLTRHQYYYKEKGEGKRGAKASTETIRVEEGKEVIRSNTEVIEQMRANHDDPDLHYGYQRMTSFLQLLGYLINHKKVYRLMGENQLLHDRKKRSKKQYVKYRIVIPGGPLEVLEMDIKFVWIEDKRKHAFVLTILDVFTRNVLVWHTGMSITRHTVKEVFTQVIIEHLQANDMLKKGVHIEIRNDNDPRFSAKSVQQFFEQNFINQVFTHPYTPQENGHVESFHSILGQSLDKHTFFTLEQLEQHLTIFYEKYNNTRIHGSLAGLPPRMFWEQWNAGNIERKVLENKKVKFKLLVPKYQLSGNEIQREASCLKSNPLNGVKTSLKTVNGAITENQSSVQRSPSIASC